MIIRGNLSVAMIGVFFLLISCKGEPTTPSPTTTRPVIRVKKQKVKAAEDISTKGQGVQRKENKKVEAFIYDATGRRDPFKPFLTEDIFPKIEKSKPKTPLQTYNVNELKLVAIILGMGKPTAMVEDPGGKGYIIKKGTLIGDRNGRVVRISKDTVFVKERFRDIIGDIKEEEVILEIPKLEEEGFK